MAGLLHFRAKQSGKQPVIALAAAVPGCGIDSFPIADFDIVKPLQRVHRNLLCCVHSGDKGVDFLHGAEFPPGQMKLLFTYDSFPALRQAPFFDEFVKAQALENAI